MKVLVVAAHPDDEILGMGGTIAKHCSNGDKVQTLIVAEGVTSREEKCNQATKKKELEKLMNTCRQANKLLGVEKVDFLGMADNRLDRYEFLDIVKKIERFIQQQNPDLIYTHFSNDLNIDHRLVSEAVLTSCRPIPNFSVKEILFFEVLSSTHWESPGKNIFCPQVFVDISDYLEKKIEALKIYESEMRDWPHARSYKTVEALAKWRGSLVGRKACEAFQQVRNLR